MAERFRELLEEWKTADRQATEAQNAVSAKFAAFVERSGQEPTEQEREHAAHLRRVADAKLALALEYMKRNSVHPTQPGDLPTG